MSGNSYHDYIFKDGKILGEFEKMYENSLEIPWHQDKMALNTSGEIVLTLIKKHSSEIKSVLDIGCGLGYFTSRIADILPKGSRVIGLDISHTAVEKAKKTFPNVEFYQADCRKPGALSRYYGDLVLCRQLFWYVSDQLEQVLRNLRVCTNSRLLVEQSFPKGHNFVGAEVIPHPDSLSESLESFKFKNEYAIWQKSREIKNVVYLGDFKKTD